jgi:hypothetical protein
MARKSKPRSFPSLSSTLLAVTTTCGMTVTMFDTVPDKWLDPFAKPEALMQKRSPY